MPGVLQGDGSAGELLGRQDGRGAIPPPEEGHIEEYIVIKQDVTIDVNFQGKSIQGESRITIFCLNMDDPPEEVAIDARQCTVDMAGIKVDGKPVLTSYRDPYEALVIPPAWDLTSSNHPVWERRMKELMPRRRSILPVSGREKTGCVPANGALRVTLRSKAQSSKLVIRNPSSVDQNPRSAKSQHEGLFQIIIPFRTSHFRDGLHFVGVEPNDTRFPHVYTRHSIEPGTASSIFPCVDDPGARCTWTIHIKCPRTLGDALGQPLASHPVVDGFEGPSQSSQLSLMDEEKLLDMTVVCSGTLVGEKLDEVDETKKIMTFEIADHPAAAQHVGFAVGPFEHVDLWSKFRSEEADEKLGASALKIHGYCLPGREDEVRNTCEALTMAADDFAMTYGRYPYDSYKVCFVDDQIPTTVPLLGFSLCSNRVLYSEEIIDPEAEVTRKVVHSLACQYFGVYIVPNERSDIWLTVSIAWFMTDLFLSKLCGNNDYRFRMKTMADKLVLEDFGRPPLHELGNCLHLGDFEMDFMALKGPLVLFILDKRLTKASNSASANLARVISKVIGKANTQSWGETSDEVLSSESFIKLCERTSQYKLEVFWKEWVLGSGCPWLDISQKFNKKQLQVDVVLNQLQAGEAAKARPIQREEFWRELVEDVNHIYAGDVQAQFTGPMTIRVHEANGTPYEHTVEIREEHLQKASKLPIPYNTKYKRLKRNRRQREKQAAAATDAKQEAQDDAIVFSLGDKLESREDVEAWQLDEWNPQDENNMDGESYEWIRVDSDFEWIWHHKVDMKPWMYTSQLQQDRDVVAQQESLVYLSKLRQHAMSATILIRTLVDERYYHGLRTMAAEILARQTLRSVKDNANAVVHRGMFQLLKAFQLFFCYPDSQIPKPNDFWDKKQYLLRNAIVTAIAQVQHEGFHPREAQKFLLDQLRFNNNADNDYSDHFYVARLLEALATSLMSTSPAQKEKAADMSFAFDDGDGDDEDMLMDDGPDLEAQEILDAALAEIDRYQKMDEWTGSYQNVWTRAALTCKQKLMRAGVIKLDPLEFVRYLQDGTLDLVQIRAFEALVELELMLKPLILKLLLITMTTHPSPFMRDQLFKIFCRGLASVAFGDHVVGGAEQEDEKIHDGGLIIEVDAKVIMKKQAAHTRREDIGGAVQALKEAVQDDIQLRTLMWDAMHSPIIGSVELRNLLTLFGTIFGGDYSLLLTVKRPTMWTVQRPELDRAVLTFKAIPRPLRETPPPAPAPLEISPAAEAAGAVVAAAPLALVIPPVAAAPEVVKKTPKIKLTVSNLKSQAPKDSIDAGRAGTNGTPPGPKPVAPRPQTKVRDSIAVVPTSPLAANGPEPVALQVLPPLGRADPAPNASASAPAAAAKPAPKRKRDDRSTTGDSPSPQPPHKLLKLSVAKHYHRLLRADTRQLIEDELQRDRGALHRAVAAPAPTLPHSDSINVLPSMRPGHSPPPPPSSTPARKPLPSGERRPLPSGGDRRPLPSGAGSSPPPPSVPIRKFKVKRTSTVGPVAEAVQAAAPGSMEEED